MTPATASVRGLAPSSVLGAPLQPSGVQRLGVCQPARLSRRRPQAASAALMVAPAASLLVQGATCVAWASAFVLAGRLLLQQQQGQAEEGPRRECETCGGSGFVECWCSRWSDGDGGCSTCRGSGRMVCSSCRGGGTAVPIEARLTIRNEGRTDNFRRYK